MIKPENGLGGKLSVRSVGEIHLGSRRVRMGIERYGPIKQLKEIRETYMSLQALK